MKLWIDDIRKKPSNYDFWAKSYDEAITILNTEKITHISFDHDLGSENDNGMDTGYDIARIIEKWAHDGDIQPMT
jgi:aspartyl/asparaginyl-tRNA synthetase